MIRIDNSLEKWVNGASSLQKEALHKVYDKLDKIQKKWVNELIKSIELWKAYIFVRMRAVDGDRFSNVDDPETSKKQAGDQISKFIDECETSVLKALKNVEKLYMVPYQSLGLQHNNSPRDKKPQKMRSTSVGSSLSNSRHRKNSLISTIKNQIKAPQTKTVSTVCKYSGYSSTVSKQYRPKPKYEELCSTNTNNTSIGFHSRQSSTTVTAVCQELSHELEQRFVEKSRERERNRENQIIKNYSEHFQARLNSIQSDLNSKLDIIISNLGNQPISSNLSPQVIVDNLETQSVVSNLGTQSKFQQLSNLGNQNIKNDYQLIQKMKEKIQVVEGRDRIKKPYSKHKVVFNPVIDEEDCLHLVTAKKQEISIDKSRTDKIQKSTFHHKSSREIIEKQAVRNSFSEPQNNNKQPLHKPTTTTITISTGSQKKVQPCPTPYSAEFEEKTKHLVQFIQLSKKTKLPLTPILLKILSNSFHSLLPPSSPYPPASPQLAQLPPSEPLTSATMATHRSQLKQSLLKMKRLLSMGGIEEAKRDKIVAYVQKFLLCCSFIVIGERLPASGVVLTDLEYVLAKL